MLQIDYKGYKSIFVFFKASVKQKNFVMQKSKCKLTIFYEVIRRKTHVSKYFYRHHKNDSHAIYDPLFIIFSLLIKINI